MRVNHRNAYSLIRQVDLHTDDCDHRRLAHPNCTSLRLTFTDVQLRLAAFDLAYNSRIKPGVVGSFE